MQRLRLSAMAVLILALVPLATARAQRTTFPSPAGYWSFDLCESASPFRTWDAARAPHHAYRSYGAFCSGFGRYGSSGYFDGIDNLVEIPYTAVFNVTNALTVSAWVYPQNLSKWQTVVNKWYAPDSWALFIEPSGRYNFTVALPGGNKTVTATATLNAWTHVAGVYNGSSVRLYINGVLAGSVAASGNVNASGRAVAIGSHPGWNAMQGYIDEVKLYKQALSAGQVSALAVPPGAVGTRGLHLMPSQWVCDPALYGAGCNTNNVWAKFQKDLDYIHSIGNLNSVKTAVFSYKDDNPGIWLSRQNEKLAWLFSATGNHKTWIVRAWPSMCGNGEACDCPADANGNRDYYTCGYSFAQNLISQGGSPGPLDYLVNTLKVQNLYIEVANEPNLPEEGFGSSSANYNDFFRGFYWGERSYGYTLPLVYAGLSPGCNEHSACTADAWYQDYWVRDHIQNYAAKIGVHVYWASTDPSAWNNRLSQKGGRYYQRVKNLLAPAVSARGIQITEFNVNRSDASLTTDQQAAEACAWWKQEVQDAAAGWWVEQATLFVTDTEDGSWSAEYVMADDQIDNIRSGCP